MARARTKKVPTYWDEAAEDVLRPLIRRIRPFKAVAGYIVDEFGEQTVTTVSLQNKLARGKFSFQFALMCLYGAGYGGKEVTFLLPALSPEVIERIRREAPQEPSRPSPNRKTRQRRTI